MKYVFLTIAALSITGCSQLGLDGLLGGRDAAKPANPAADASAGDTVQTEARPISTGPVMSTGAQTAEAYDITSDAEKAAAKDAVGGRELGVTVASLGAPAEPGFWLKTPLASKPGKGRVQLATTGQSVQVDLIPIDGPETAGSRLSLAAMRLLDVPLTSLPELRVFQAGS
ncbi:hypothetical protein G5B38_00355 [Pseudohalocynthiibacter aestuariivivens]|uniref:D-galactarate dehydratase n=1 Tax=Roseovarius pelagicus TaxID=2980108 RepID=A0ABY6DGC9_9RHOB|nr:MULTISPECIES: hypothetical protein [Rhodobacterales]QIE44101.1 hypothetical protein G5B38_00355 [Pseudohalocynthiibacter aestuariivivens]UXX83998.1 hypothetical protein N7U68_04910 [Roseovarius pelagicus]